MNIEKSIVKTIRDKKPFRDIKEFPRQSDIVITDSGEENEWDKLENSQDRTELAHALRSIRLVVIEVKHTELLQDDRDKYCNLIKGLAYNTRSKGKDKDKLLRHHRFVILSSHTDAARKRIVRKKDRNAEEQRWHEFFKSKYDGVKHMTLESIYNEIEDNPTWRQRSAVLQFFECYLALHLGNFHTDPDPELRRAYWSETIKAPDSSFDLKWSIANHINWLAKNHLIKTVRGEGNKWHMYKARKLKRIVFEAQQQHGHTVQFEYNSKRSTSQLEIVLDGIPHPLDTEEIKRSRDCGKIIETLEKVVKTLESQVV
jgi:hypothetical protein